MANGFEKAIWTMVNLDISWNPAVLEQRIARIYRLGQERNVSIINLVSTGDRKSTRLNSSHRNTSRMPSSA